MFFIFRGCEIAIKTTHNISYELISESRATIGNFIYLLLFPKYKNDAPPPLLSKVDAKILQKFNGQNKKNVHKVLFFGCATYANLELLYIKPCKSTLFAAYLNDAQMTCILDQRKVSSSLLQAFDMQVELGKSFEECITMCYLLHPEKKCSAVKYFQTLIKCYLFAIHINATELETEDESLEIIYFLEERLFYCKQGLWIKNSLLKDALLLIVCTQNFSYMIKKNLLAIASFIAIL
ncbi:hypothetical protein T4E_1695 [Trichinella pseudospiralis]|uniref:Apple domain-containing protein n=1 Tax=Trichinella pseudospiralis TaxID=6337 RepID=A0A0V0XX83_TRIPS|nr:hypothetical protein T4E_1695 [Trichinella pseudospiralis]